MGKGTQPKPKAKGAGRPGSSKAPAAAAPSAAARRQVEISAGNEERVRELLQELAAAEPDAAASGPSASTALSKGSSEKQLARYTQLYEKLLEYRFKPVHVQQVLRTLPTGPQTDLEACLDWLCLHLPQSELPKRFAGVARAGVGNAAGVKVVARRQHHHQRTQQEAVAADDISSSDSDSSTSSEAEEASTSSAAATKPDDAAAAKAWILQQYAGHGSDDDDASQASSSSSEIEAWELWGDPREIERRRAQRTAQRLPLEQQRAQVLSEFGRAREWAASAKAAGDRGGQKDAGRLIAGLKAEMGRLGISEAEANAAWAPAAGAGAGGEAGVAAVAANGAGGGADAAAEMVTQAEAVEAAAAGDRGEAAEVPPPSSAAGAMDRAAVAELSNGKARAPEPPSVAHQGNVGAPQDAGDDWEAMLADGLFDGPATAEAESAAATAGAGAAAAGTAAAAAAADGAPAASGVGSHTAPPSHQDQPQIQQAVGAAEQDEAAWTPGDLFDDNGEPDAAPKPAVPPPPPPREVFTPWGNYGSSAKRKKAPMPRATSAAAAAAAAAAAQQQQLPKALLQKHCQKAVWAAPRFERVGVVGAAGAGDVAGREHRYSVTVDPGSSAVRGKAAKHAAAAGVLTGPKTYQLLADEDGWPSIQDAQNAAATRALFDLLPQQPLYHSLASPFRELWLRWYQQKEEGREVSAEGQQQQEREEFVRALLLEQQEQQQQQQQEDEPAEDDSAPNGALPPNSERATADEEASEWELAAASRLDQQQQEREEQQRRQAEQRDAAHAAQRGAALRRQLLDWRASQQGAEWLHKRGQLPIATVREQLSAALQASDVVVVSGETGSGKTTQVPQFILEEATLSGAGAGCSIVVTQPRRIAAVSVAERVASERGEAAPGAPGAAVGYHVRLDACTSRDTRLLFCTTGILLRRLSGDPQLRSISHVIVDEVHERTLQGDFLMALLRRLMQQRNRDSSSNALPPLKVVLMSATLDSAAFSAYFGNCPVISCQGRTFPVEHLFLEDVYEATGYALDPESRAALRSGQAQAHAARMRKQAAGGSSSKQALLSGGWGDEEKGTGPLNPNYDPDRYSSYSLAVRRNLARLDEECLDLDLVEAVVAYIDEMGDEGAILVFMPGMGEISALLERLSSSRRFARGSHWLLPLHSTISPAEQRRAFEVPPAGVRKIVIATNIAETSVTIEDVVFVVDGGRFRERRYNPSRHMSMLVEDWISVASAMQRKGRAGRVRPGRCFCLYTRHRFEHVMRKQGQPEMVRVPLEELVLQIHLMQLGPAADFLSNVLEPPARRAIDAALASLRDVGALQEAQEALTPLGRHLASLPVDPRLGKLLVLGACLGCLSPALTIAAAMSYKSPFAAPLDKQDELNRAKLALAAPANSPGSFTTNSPGSFVTSSSSGGSGGGGGGNGMALIAAGQQSDHLLLVAAYELWRSARKQGRSEAAKVTRQHFLSQQTLEALSDMRSQFAAMLVDIRLLHSPDGGRDARHRGGTDWVDDLTAEWNVHARQAGMVKAVLCAALSPHVATVLAEKSEPGGRPAWQDETRTEVAVHPGSVNHMLLQHQLREPYLVYLEKAQTSRVFLRDTTVVSPMALLLFGGALTVLHEEGAVLVGGWLKLRAAAQTAVLVKHVRAALDALLEARVAASGSSSSSSSGARDRGDSSSSRARGGAAAAARGGGGDSSSRGDTSGRGLDGIGSSRAGHDDGGNGSQERSSNGAEQKRRQQAAAVVQTIQQLLLEAEAASTARLEGR